MSIRASGCTRFSFRVIGEGSGKREGGQKVKEREEEAHDGGQEIDHELKMVWVGAVREPPLRRGRGGYFP